MGRLFCFGFEISERKLESSLASYGALSVPSPLAGEGQGEGCHTGILSVARLPRRIINNQHLFLGYPPP
ncbi:hypothetical protein TM239_52780 [Bradyrhizobium sp. TM239]|nr:hypothetical protein TM239_52780 [Bradyrhizobium sp. TM239]